jgi:hypothetical protein
LREQVNDFNSLRTAERSTNPSELREDCVFELSSFHWTSIQGID